MREVEGSIKFERWSLEICLEVAFVEQTHCLQLIVCLLWVRDLAGGYLMGEML